MTALRFMVVQQDHNGWPEIDDKTYGTLKPVNLDGFYSRQEDADAVADYMAEMRPDLETYVVQIVRAVRVHS